MRALERAGIRIESGVLSDRCDDLIRGFREWILRKRPWVELKLAASLDGRIAAEGGASKWLSSPESRALVQRMRARSDAIPKCSSCARAGRWHGRICCASWRRATCSSC
jgi:diaminohydroxyphosphoribosylaminopyrimidine deaminase/5-amino-6-(5-phosphoribosylamino)uracil reductase